MKYLFTIVFIVLIILSFITFWNFPDNQTDVPVIYWVTDPNPARKEQVATFSKWLVRNGYVNGEGKPAYQVRVDSSNCSHVKKIIQCVSGIGADNMDMSGGGDVRYFANMGLISDVTEDGKRLNFDPTQTYPAIRPSITIDGRQYSFPCNVNNRLFWVNKETFEKYNQPLPPESWTFEEFERLGKNFVEAANKSGSERTVFYAPEVNRLIMHRSLGLGVFNETLTACTLDDPRYINILNTIHKWMYVDHIIPTIAEQQSFSARSGYEGSAPQLLYSGNYGMIASGRFMLIQFRQFPRQLKLAVIEHPNGGYPNSVIRTRTCSIYVDSQYPEGARLFMSYLASEDYNMQLVNDADALPPNPKYAEIEAYKKPEKYTNEWGLHEVFYDKAMEIAIGVEFSPFVNEVVYKRINQDFYVQFIEGLIDAPEAARLTEQSINAEIQRSLSEKPNLKSVYEIYTEDQKLVDDLKRRGEKIPKRLIRNPFYLKYYSDMGLLD